LIHQKFINKLDSQNKKLELTQKKRGEESKKGPIENSEFINFYQTIPPLGK